MPTVPIDPLICLLSEMHKSTKHSGIAGRYQNIEFLGPLFHHFNLKTQISSHFIRPTADTIFWVMRFMWKCAKIQISHLYLAWVAMVFEKWPPYVLIKIEWRAIQIPKFVLWIVPGFCKVPFPPFNYHFQKYIHMCKTTKKPCKAIYIKPFRNLGLWVKIPKEGR